MSDALSDDPKEYTCCICGKESEGWGNNPDPVTNEAGEFFKEDAQCCDECNDMVVIPKRLEEMLG
jgi:hypothetical protein